MRNVARGRLCDGQIPDPMALGLQNTIPSATADPSFWWCRDVRKVVRVPREWPFAPREDATYLEKLASEVMEQETLWGDLHAMPVSIHLHSENGSKHPFTQFLHGISNGDELQDHGRALRP